MTGVLVSRRLEIGQISTQRVGKNAYQADLSIRGRTPSAISSAIEAIDAIAGVDIITTTQAD